MDTIKQSKHFYARQQRAMMRLKGRRERNKTERQNKRLGRKK